MDPVLGRPKTENLFQIQNDLKLMEKIEFNGVPGENDDMAWIPRGPTNIGGRTKAALCLIQMMHPTKEFLLEVLVVEFL